MDDGGGASESNDGADLGSDNRDVLAAETAWKIHGAVTDWTGKVDAKATFALTIESATVVAIISLTTPGRIFADLGCSLVEVALIVSIVLLVVAAGLAALVVIPRLRTRASTQEWKSNFIYFGHLRYWAPDDLALAIRDQPLLPVLSRQIVRMSEIVWRKHRLVQASLRLALLAAALLLIVLGFKP